MRLCPCNVKRCGEKDDRFFPCYDLAQLYGSWASSSPCHHPQAPQCVHSLHAASVGHIGRFQACVLSRLAERVSAGRSPVHFDCPGRTEMDPAGLDLDRPCLAGGRWTGLAAVRAGVGIDHIEMDLVGFDPVHCSRLRDSGRHIGTGLAVPHTERHLAG